MTSPPFTAERREQLLVALAAGASLTSACASVGVSRTTVYKWAARGRAGAPDAQEFSQRFDRVRLGACSRTAEEEIERTLEAGTRRGSVSAARALMALRRRRAEEEPDEFAGLPEGHPWRYTDASDPVLALSPELLAYLTPEEAAQVRDLHADGSELDAVLDCSLAWAEQIRERMQPPYKVDWRSLRPEMVIGMNGAER
jgi:transposase